VDVVQIVFETHSTSEDNERGIATGWLGGKLSLTGQAQALQLGERRRYDNLAAVYSSDLNRAVETARIAFEGTAIPVSLDWRLRECNYGTLNGMSREQLDMERPRRLDQPFPEGESWREAVARVVSFLHEVAADSEGKRVLLIGHVATRWALDHYVLGVPLERLVAAPFQWREGWEYPLRATSRS
jgi:2,3-bisphosphoglycerate-dependent phosphoglycerate mutase